MVTTIIIGGGLPSSQSSPLGRKSPASSAARGRPPTSGGVARFSDHRHQWTGVGGGGRRPTTDDYIPRRDITLGGRYLVPSLQKAIVRFSLIQRT